MLYRGAVELPLAIGRSRVPFGHGRTVSLTVSSLDRRDRRADDLEEHEEAARHTRWFDCPFAGLLAGQRGRNARIDGDGDVRCGRRWWMLPRADAL